MDSVFFIQLCTLVILLLFAAFMALFAAKTIQSEKKEKKNAKGHICKDCLFCRNGNCRYILEDGIDVYRPACKYFEERIEYQPA